MIAGATQTHGRHGHVMGHQAADDVEAVPGGGGGGDCRALRGGLGAEQLWHEVRAVPACSKKGRAGSSVLNERRLPRLLDRGRLERNRGEGYREDDGSWAPLSSGLHGTTVMREQSTRPHTGLGCMRGEEKKALFFYKGIGIYL